MRSLWYVLILWSLAVVGCSFKAQLENIFYSRNLAPKIQNTPPVFDADLQKLVTQVTVKLLDDKGQPLPNAKPVLADYSVTNSSLTETPSSKLIFSDCSLSDANGEARCEIQTVEPGIYKIYIAKVESQDRYDNLFMAEESRLKEVIFYPKPEMFGILIGTTSTVHTGGGTKIQISGDHFRSGASIYIDGLPCESVEVVSANLASCVSPALSAGIKSLKIVNDDKQRAEMADAITASATAPPTLTTLLPRSGSMLGNTKLTLSGSGFSSGMSVSLDGIACTNIVVVSSRQATCVTAPSGTVSGPVDLVLHTGFGDGNYPGAFTYTPNASSVPSIASITPNVGHVAGNTLVTIAGSGLNATTSVKIGDIVCANVQARIDGQQLTCYTGASPSEGVRDVVIANAGVSESTTLSQGFTYSAQAPPTVNQLQDKNGVSLAQGSAAGGYHIQLEGSGFADVTAVLVDGNSCTAVTLVSPKLLSCVMPAGSGNDVEFEVQTAHGSFTFASAFDYVTPVLTLTSPDPVQEGAPAVFNFSLNVLSGPVDIAVKTANDTALAEVDYLPQDTVVHFDEGQMTASLSIETVRNLQNSDTLKFLLNVVSVTPSMTVAGTPGQGFIENIDELPTVNFIADQTVDIGGPAAGNKTVTVSVQLSAVSRKAVTVPFTVSGTAKKDSPYQDYSVVPTSVAIPAGASSASFTFLAIDDGRPQLPETVVFTMGGVTNAQVGSGNQHTVTLNNLNPLPELAIADVTVDEDQTAVLTVQASHVTGRPLSFYWNTVDGSATVARGNYVPVDPAQLITIPENADSVTVSVRTLQDHIYNHSIKNLKVVLSNPYPVLTLAKSEGVISIRNIDDAPVLTISDIAVNESESPAILTVTSSNLSDEDTAIVFSTVPDSAFPGYDYTNITNGFVILPARAAATTISVPLLESGAYKKRETFKVHLISTNNGATLGAPSVATVTIVPTLQLPLSLSSQNKISLWLDARHNRQLITSGSTLSQWRDKSLNNNHGLVSGPLSVNASGLGTSLPSVHFSGSEIVDLGSANLINNFSSTVFVVGKSASLDSSARGLFRLRTNNTINSGAMYFQAEQNSGKSGFVGHRFLDLGAGARKSNLRVPNVLILNVRASSGSELESAAKWNFTKNGTLYAGLSQGTFISGQNQSLIGSSDVAGSSPWAGDISEILVFDGGLNSAEIDSVTNYLKNKWALVGAPDDISFPDLANVDRYSPVPSTTSETLVSTRYTSAPVLLTGFFGSLSTQVSSSAVPASPLLMVNGSEMSGSESLAVNDQLRLKMYSSPQYETTHTAQLSLANASDTQNTSWNVTTHRDFTPDAMAGIFVMTTGAEPDSVVQSNVATVTGFAGPLASYVQSPRTVNPTAGAVPATQVAIRTASPVLSAFNLGGMDLNSGDGVQLQCRTSGNWDTLHEIEMSLGTETGSYAAIWAVRTRSQDISPDVFGFIDPTPSTVYPQTMTTSNTITVSGFDGPILVGAAQASCTEADCQSGDVFTPQISINGGPWVTSGQIWPGQTLAVRATSSLNPDGYEKRRKISVTMGTGSTVWTIVTKVQDVAPSAFTIPAVSGVELNTLTGSTAFTVSGFDGPLTATVSGAGNPEIRLSPSGTWGPSVANLYPGQSLEVRLTSSGNWSTAATATVTLGSVSANFVVTTRAQDTVPNGIVFTAVKNVHDTSVTSNAVTLSGFDSAPPISAAVTAGGPATIVKNGVDTGLSSGVTFVVGDTIALKTTVPSAPGANKVVSISIGGGSASWSVTAFADCNLPWGGTLAHGSSATAYSTNSPSGSCSSVQQTRSCTDGTLSGSYTYGLCLSGCSLPWGGGITSGQSVTAYQASNPAGSCVSQSRTCSNGTLSGSYTNASCVNGCNLPWGGAIASGGTVTAYQASNPAGSCVSQARTCSNGTLSGSYGYGSCANGCGLPWGGAIASGSSVTAWASYAPAGTCAGETRTCSNGSLSGSYGASYCNNGCAAPWGWMTHGATATAYQDPNPAGGCAAESRSCNNGSLNGSYAYTTCSNGCSLPWGGAIASGASVTAYSVSSGTSCPSQVRSCSNGTLSGSYGYASCTVSGGGGGGGGGGCFVAGTRITMADGSLKAIELVAVGDEVLTVDEITGQKVVSRVTRLHHHAPQAQDLVRFELADGSVVTATDVHPMYVVEHRGYYKAKEIVSMYLAGQKLSLLNIQGAPVAISNLRLEQQDLPVYNFEVAGLGSYSDIHGVYGIGHNYFAEGVLVHNALYYDQVIRKVIVDIYMGRLGVTEAKATLKY